MHTYIHTYIYIYICILSVCMYAPISVSRFINAYSPYMSKVFPPRKDASDLMNRLDDLEEQEAGARVGPEAV